MVGEKWRRRRAGRLRPAGLPFWLHSRNVEQLFLFLLLGSVVYCRLYDLFSHNQIEYLMHMLCNFILIKSLIFSFGKKRLNLFLIHNLIQGQIKLEYSCCHISTLPLNKKGIIWHPDLVSMELKFTL